jgi:hypothetical protein
MKVISTPSSDWSKRITCSRCESILQAEISDLRKRFVKGCWDPRPGEGSSDHWDVFVNCAVCSNEIAIRDKIGYAIEQKIPQIGGSGYDPYDR